MHQELLKAATKRLRAAGIESAALDARLLLQKTLNLTAEELLLRDKEEIAVSALAQFEEYIARRQAREPLVHITGEKEFYGRDFKVNAHVLAPRADSEILIEAVLAYAKNAKTILDLGTGSGCLLLTLLAELKDTTGVGVDISKDALSVAKHNAEKLALTERVKFRNARWCEGLEKKFDVVISNPPYIPTQAIAQLMPEVASFEPMLALDGGKDGLDSYHEIANHLKQVLTPSGVVAFEIGIAQHNEVAAILEAAGFRILEIKNDLAGIPRCIVATQQA